jgi:hypothetical protein
MEDITPTMRAWCPVMNTLENTTVIDSPILRIGSKMPGSESQAPGGVSPWAFSDL